MSDNTIDIKAEFEAQVMAALMMQANALVPIKTAVKLCGISRQEIYRRIERGSFPKPEKLSSREKSIRKAFYLQDLHEWIADPQGYRQSEH